jgi:hypothetical protein
MVENAYKRAFERVFTVIKTECLKRVKLRYALVENFKIIYIQIYN